MSLPIRGRSWIGFRSPVVSGLWEHLADLAEDSSERGRLLISALGIAEGFDEVRRIRERLDRLETQVEPDPEASSQGGI